MVGDGMKTNSILVIIPTYREYDNLCEFTQKLRAACPEASLLIVDDASGDGAPAWVRSQPQFEKDLFLIERPAKFGLATAYLDGFRWALARPFEFIVQMDADISHDPAAIPGLLQAAAEADLVLTSRYLPGGLIRNWPKRRLLLSRSAAQYVRLLTRMPFTDPTGGFKCWRRDLLEKFDFAEIQSTGYGFQIEMTHIAWRLGARIVEIPIVFEGRHAGLSKMSGPIAREAFWEVIRLALRGKGSGPVGTGAS
jgi:dolichol-phosphate mannosyltransferase